MLESKKTTSTVVTATVVSLALLGVVKFTSQRGAPAESSATGAEFAPSAIEPLAQEGDGGAALIENAFQSRLSGQVVQLRGVVRTVLPDERDGRRRQRWTLELEGGRTLLVSHDLESSGRVPAAVGDELELSGRYEWNNRGGAVVDTHTRPDDELARGWVRHADVDYR